MGTDVSAVQTQWTTHLISSCTLMNYTTIFNPALPKYFFLNEIVKHVPPANTTHLPNV